VFGGAWSVHGVSYWKSSMWWILLDDVVLADFGKMFIVQFFVMC
jgi:hypothetical protein